MEKGSAGENITLTPKPTFFTINQDFLLHEPLWKERRTVKGSAQCGFDSRWLGLFVWYSPQTNAPCKRFRKSKKRRSRKSLKASQPIAILRGVFKPLFGTIRADEIRFESGKGSASGDFSEPFHPLVSP